MPGPLGLPLNIEDTPPNFIQNGALLYFQEKISNTVANGGTEWVADGFYVRNSMGATSVLTSSAGSTSEVNGNRSLSLTATTAPTAGFGEWRLFQTVPNEESRALMGKISSFCCQIKAIGNVTQVGLQFLYKTTNTRVSFGEPTIGAEALCSVSTLDYSLCQLANRDIGTAMTLAGVVGIQIRVTAVSSGNIYDVGNGIEFTLAQGNIGAPSKGFRFKGDTVAGELKDCQRSYCKSYELDTSPLAATYPVYPGAVVYLNQLSYNGPINDGMVYFPCAGRGGLGTVTIYSPESGAAGKAHTYGQVPPPGAAVFAAETLDWAANVAAQSDSGMYVFLVESAVPVGDRIAFHWVRDCRLV